jgi:hypothetical protein
MSVVPLRWTPQMKIGRRTSTRAASSAAGTIGAGPRLCAAVQTARHQSSVQRRTGVSSRTRGWCSQASSRSSSAHTSMRCVWRTLRLALGG